MIVYFVSVGHSQEGSVSKVVEIDFGHLRACKILRLSGGLVNGGVGDGLRQGFPTTYLLHDDLARGHQRPDHHRHGFANRPVPGSVRGTFLPAGFAPTSVTG